jgi:hypothetical protein
LAESASSRSSAKLRCAGLLVMVSALRHGFSGRRSHVGTAERGR